jgi:ADP-ribose pyrophosphatase YjhB (NUDIX family)
MLKELLNQGTSSICPAAVIIKNNCILLGLRNYTPDKWKNISVWTTPGGRCDQGETLEQALRREVKEEVDIHNFEILDFIGKVAGAKEGDEVPVFFCTTDFEPKLMEPEKFSTWKWIPIKEYLDGGQYQEMNPEAHKLISNYLQN